MTYLQKAKAKFSRLLVMPLWLILLWLAVRGFPVGCWSTPGDWERGGLTSWTFADMPERLEVTTVSGIPVFGFPGLGAEAEDLHLHVRIPSRPRPLEGNTVGITLDVDRVFVFPISES